MLKEIAEILSQVPSRSELWESAHQAINFIKRGQVLDCNFGGHGWEPRHYWDIYKIRYDAMLKTNRSALGMKETLDSLSLAKGRIFGGSIRVAEGQVFVFLNETRDELVGCFFVKNDDL